MHARDLVELAGLVSVCGGALVEGCRQIPHRAVVQYWTTSKLRHERWGWTLKNAAHYLENDKPSSLQRPLLLYGTLEEIFSAELLVRTCAALFHAYDRRHDSNDTAPLATSVFHGQAEARHRALTLLVQNSQIETTVAIKLDRLRQRAERWSDLLLSHMTVLGEVSDFAFDADRVKDFAETSRPQDRSPTEPYPWPLLLGSLRSAFTGQLDFSSPNADLIAGIAAGVLACLPREAVERYSFSHALWLTRILAEADEAQDMLDSLMAPALADSL